MRLLKVLDMAVATGLIGYVFLVGDQLKDWGLSRKASRNPELAAVQANKWITDLKPDIVVTEKVPPHSSKSAKTRLLIAAIQFVAAKASVLDMFVSHTSAFKNKYEEAQHLGERFPEIAAWVPRARRIWEPEPKNTVLFEALALATVIIDQ